MSTTPNRYYPPAPEQDVIRASQSRASSQIMTRQEMTNTQENTTIN